MALDDITRRSVLQISAAAMAGIVEPAVTTTDASAQPAPAATAGNVSVADYIAIRLRQLGCNILFGVPGATCDPMFNAAVQRNLKPLITASDLEAGYAADGYARMRGLGAVCVTYGVGTLSLINAIAGAYAERSPVVVLNGGPTDEDLRRLRQDGTLFSHSLGIVPPRRPGQTEVPEADMLGDLAVFRRACVHAVRITRSADAAAEIDKALLAAMREQRPVYVEVTKALWTAKIPAPSGVLQPPVVPAAGEAALAGQILAKLRSAQRPVLLLGEQVGRYKLEDAVTALTRKLQIPFVTTFLGKAAISEQEANFVGVYDGKSAPAQVRRVLGGADAVLALGCTFGRQYWDLFDGATWVNGLMNASDNQYRVARGTAVAANLGRLVTALNAGSWTPVPAHLTGRSLDGRSFAQRRASQQPATGVRAGLPGPGLTYNALVETVSGFLDAGFVTMTDTSLSQYPGADMNIAARRSFVCNGIWNAIGYSPAAAVGVGMAEKEAETTRRPLVICGDGGFQMNAQSLSTLARNGIWAIVIVLDNGLYAIEEFVINGSDGYFSDPNQEPVPHLKLARWDYVMLANAMGVTSARKVATVAELAQALQDFKTVQGPALISAAMNPRSLPSELFS